MRIVNDLTDEPDETAVVALSNPTNAVVSDNNLFTYTIVDNDLPPLVNFQIVRSSGSRSCASPRVAVQRKETSSTSTRLI